MRDFIFNKIKDLCPVRYEENRVKGRKEKWRKDIALIFGNKREIEKILKENTPI